MEKYKEIERSIITTYRKEIWSKFVKAVTEYKLIEENDNIMVCISGGKDSFLLAKLIQELINHGKFPFKAHFVTMNPGYSNFNLNLIKENAKLLNIPLEVFDTNIYDTVFKIEKNPCYLCARMRRGYLYSKAKELGCNKIALGHHFNDVIETTLLSMFFGSEVKTMLPKLHSENFEGLELIRPMYLIKEENILNWKNANELTFINCACRFTDNCSINSKSTSKRRQMKELIKELKKEDPSIDDNLFTSMTNINLNCVLGYKLDDKKHSFLDSYEG